MRHSFSLVCTAQCSPGFHWIHLWVLLFRHWHPLCNVIVKQPVCVVSRATLLASLVSVQFHWKPSLLYVSWVQCHAQPPSCPVAWITHMQILMIHFLVLLGTTGLPKMDEFTLDVQIPFFLLHFYVPMSTLMQLSRDLLNCKGRFIFISHDWHSGIN